MNAQQLEEFNSRRDHLKELEIDLEDKIEDAVLKESWDDGLRAQRRLDLVLKTRRRLEDRS